MKQIIFAVSVLLAFASCTKSSTSTIQNDAIFRSGKWRMKSYTYRYEYTPGRDTVIDVFTKRDTCYSDDYLTFDSSYSGAQHTGVLKCAGELDQIPFKWQLKDNQKTLILNDAHFTFGNTSLTNSPTKGIEYVEASITKINNKSFTITYDMSANVLVDMRPAIDTTYFVDATVYFTQTFEK